MSEVSIVVDKDYVFLIQEIKKQVKTAQLRAHRAVNTELVRMYWLIGKELLVRQKIERWGSGYLKQVSRDLKAAFPEMAGFSVRNLIRMRQFAYFYEEPITPQPVAQLPWSHISELIQRVKESGAREWYIQQALGEGWSRKVLVLMIKSDLQARKRESLKITNFDKTLPAAQSDMAKEMLQDPYCFEFLNIQKPVNEYRIEQALIKNIRDFLLQLGRGFAFVGSQYHLKIGETDFYIDCLFYNFKMRCFVVIELKTGRFKAEYTGQLNLYLTGIDRLLKSPEDNPTIGLVLCESKDEIVAQYAVDGMAKPMGISQYELGQALTQHIKGLHPKTPSMSVTSKRVRFR